MSGHDKTTHVSMSDATFSDEVDAIDDFRRATAAYRSQVQDFQSRMTTVSNRDSLQDILDALPSDATKLALQMRNVLEEQKDG